MERSGRLPEAAPYLSRPYNNYNRWERRGKAGDVKKNKKF
jgi:hypothetical protein